MKQERRFESIARQVAQTRLLIADLDIIVQILNADIEVEERRLEVFDPARPDYPILARAMKGRRDNLLETIAALRQRLTIEERELA